MSRHLLLGSALLLALLAPPGPIRAEGPAEGAGPLTRLLGGLGTRVWGGPRVDPPLPEPRPAHSTARVSADGAIAVHADPSVDPARIASAFEHLASARVMARALGWGEPLPDGGRGDTMGFDLYLVDAPVGARGVSDGLDHTGTLDGAIAHAVVGSDAVDLEACVLDAYAQALLLGLDPAESERVRRAFAAWITFAVTGRAGCDDALEAWQHEPEAGPFDEVLHRGAGGALFLALLDERYEGDGRFPRELHQLLRQRTFEGERLRGSPDVWESIEAIAESRGDRLHDLLADLSVARAAPAETSPHPIVRALRQPPRTVHRGSPKKLPWHSPASARGVAAGGAAYARIGLGAFGPGDALGVWLEGEFGTRLTLVVVALDARGRELSRRSSPPGGTLHRAFVPLVVPESTHELLLVASSLGRERADEDTPEPVARRIRFIVSVSP